MGVEDLKEKEKALSTTIAGLLSLSCLRIQEDKLPQAPAAHFLIGPDCLESQNKLFLKFFGEIFFHSTGKVGIQMSLEVVNLRDTPALRVPGIFEFTERHGTSKKTESIQTVLPHRNIKLTKTVFVFQEKGKQRVAWLNLHRPLGNTQMYLRSMY